MIVCFVDIGGIVDHRCLDVFVRFADIGGIGGHQLISNHLIFSFHHAT